jgi:GDPmannose 4,6-dehydratase
MKKALITGITGQDGSYLAELLLGKGYQVHGIIRRSSSFNTGRLDDIYQDPQESRRRLFLHYGDLADSSCLRRVLSETRPDEVYNLGAQSHVRVSFDQAEYTLDIDGTGTLRLLDAIRDIGLETRFYQASSSEMFGDNPSVPQNEETQFCPSSPYAVAKVAAHHAAVMYRKAYGLFACCGILFNHESPRRGETFVTRKITRAATRIKMGLQKKLYLGNLDAVRDWGYAPEYVQAMWMMLQAEEPDDYVIATGEMRSVREFLTESFSVLDLNWEDYVKFDQRYLRPAEVPVLRGDCSKAKEKLGWQHKTSLKELVGIMIESDLTLARKEKAAFNA